MKNVFINYNAKDNLGDDLYVNIICKYFSDMKFTTIIPKNSGKGISKIPNLKIINANPAKIRRQYEKAIIKAECSMYVGGSAFTEPEDNLGDFWDFKYLFAQNPIYYISTDFGPYTNTDFRRLSEEYFYDCERVWFRDTQSKAEIEGDDVDFAPDLTFIADLPEPIKTNKQYAVIAPVDLSGRRGVTMFNEEYLKKMRFIAETLKNKGYDIITVAMCPAEWDDRVAQIFRDLGNIIVYSGDNLTQILSVIAGAKAVVGSRVHALVPAMMSGVSIVPVLYKESLEQMLRDVDGSLACFSVKKLGEVTESSVMDMVNRKPQFNKEQIKKQVLDELEKIKSEFI